MSLTVNNAPRSNQPGGISFQSDIRECLKLAIGNAQSIIPTPWGGLNSLLGGGLIAGDTTVIYGSPGIMKSWFALNLFVTALKNEYSPYLIPLEEEQAIWVCKIVAAIKNDWSLATLGNDKAIDQAYDEKPELFESLFSCVHVNPYMQGSLEDDIDDSLLSPEAVAKIILEQAQSHKLVILDNTTQVEFDCGDTTRAHRSFMRKISLIAKTTKCHIVLVVHENHSGSMNGGQIYPRIADNVLRMYRDEDHNNDTAVCLEKIRHNSNQIGRVLYIGDTTQGPAFALNKG